MAIAWRIAIGAPVIVDAGGVDMVNLFRDGWGRSAPMAMSYTSISEGYFEKRSLASPKTVLSGQTPGSTPAMLELLELLGRRWALRILWELRLEPATFQALQARCDSMSTSVLSQRLGELREAQLVEKDQAGSYGLTEPGSRLLARLDGMDQWTQEWSRLLGRPATDRRGASG